MIRRTSRIAAIVSLLALGGCAGGLRDFFPPATLGQQRLRATIHDPYPDPDLAPEVVGGRPRDYAQPLPEPVRNRLFIDSWWGR